MVVWSRSPEQGCVKRLPVRHGGESLNVGRNHKGARNGVAAASYEAWLKNSLVLHESVRSC